MPKWAVQTLLDSVLRSCEAKRPDVPSLVTDPGIIHYETYGRGRPVLLLHGWLGSWALWRNTIEVLGREFRTYALDFFGFGESGVAPGESIAIPRSA